MQRLNIYRVNPGIQSRYGKLRTKKNSLFGYFSRNVNLMYDVVTMVVLSLRDILLSLCSYIFFLFYFTLERSVDLLWLLMAVLVLVCSCIN